MTNLQRVKEVFAGLCMIIGGLFITLIPEDGYVMVAFILGVSLFFRGLRYLVYYFGMARHMVGGRAMLYMGVILLDAGLFSLTLTNIPPMYIILYLLVYHAFSGVVDIMRAREARRYDGPWKVNMSYGVLNILVALLALVGGFSSQSVEAVVYIYGPGLIYSAIVRIVRAFRKGAIVYIQ